jgi:hypothetical protein
MDSTLELLHGYTFFKLTGYELLFSFSFVSFFPFTIFSFQSLLDPLY